MTTDQRQMWSGLAPAVDAHLAYWSKAGRAVNLAMELTAGTGTDTLAEKLMYRAMADDYLHRWITFGTSYGLPDEQGIPQVVIQEHDPRVDHPHPNEHEVAMEVQDGAYLGPRRRGADHPNDRPPLKVVAQEGATIIGREQYSADGAAMFQGLSMAVREHHMLSAAITHYVSAEVMNEVGTAAALAQNEPLRETDVFCPAGFAVFEEPLTVPDLDPDTGEVTDDLWVHIRAMGWQVHDGIANISSGHVGKGVSVFWYTTREDYEEGYYRDLVATGREVPYDPKDVGDGFLPVEVLSWCFDVPWDSRETVGYIPGTVPTSVAFERRWFFAFHRLMWQTIIVRHKQEEPKRAQRRRWERLAERKPLLDYTVLRLRRIVDPFYVPGLTGTGRTLDHRVLVRAHWRNQHIKSLGPARDAQGNQIPETHRLIWIERHWRGPEDGPVGAMESATVVVR